MQKTAQSYITAFRSGENFNPSDSVAGILINNRVENGSLTLLTRELSSGTKEVRVNIVLLLEKLGLEMDKPTPDKFPIVRDQAIIRALVVGGFAKDDAATSRAATILTERCKPSDLAAFSGVFITGRTCFIVFNQVKMASTNTRHCGQTLTRLCPGWRMRGGIAPRLYTRVVITVWQPLYFMARGLKRS